MDDKQAVRDRVWALLERERVARFPGARGRIPNFVGAEAAAGRLAELDEWSSTRVLKANPDAPQLPVRARALEDGKLLYMAVPRLRTTRPFILLDPRKLAGSARSNASIRGASTAGRPVSIRQMRHVDLVICGSVAVNRLGARVGKAASRTSSSPSSPKRGSSTTPRSSPRRSTSSRSWTNHFPRPPTTSRSI